jgi:hypothetical protein
MAARAMSVATEEVRATAAENVAVIAMMLMTMAVVACQTYQVSLGNRNPFPLAPKGFSAKKCFP